MLNYIFGNLNEAEKALENMQRMIRKMKSSNRKAFVLAIISAAIAVASFIKTKELQERVAKLEETLSEMTVYEEEETEEEET